MQRFPAFEIPQNNFTGIFFRNARLTINDFYENNRKPKGGQDESMSYLSKGAFPKNRGFAETINFTRVRLPTSDPICDPI